MKSLKLSTTVLLIVFALTLPTAQSLGISPPTAQIDFAPSYEDSFEILLMNSNPFPVEVEVSISGFLAERFEVEVQEIPARGRETAKISFNLPADITPGLHTTTIYFRENYFDTTQGGLSARIAVPIVIKTWKPYPGQYADLTVSGRSVSEGQNTDARYTIHSRGDQPLNGDLEIRIQDPDGNLMDVIYENDISIEANRDYTRFVLVKSEGFEPGRYHLNAQFDYGAGVAEDESDMLIGTRSVLIDSAGPKLDIDQPINQFKIELTSLWNQPLQDVSAEMQLGSRTGATAPPITLAPFSTKELTGYWETDPNLGVGNHTALITAYFEDGGVVSKTLEVELINATELQPEENLPLRDSNELVIKIDHLLLVCALIILAGAILITLRKNHKI